MWLMMMNNNGGHGGGRDGRNPPYVGPGRREIVKRRATWRAGFELVNAHPPLVTEIASRGLIRVGLSGSRLLLLAAQEFTAELRRSALVLTPQHAPHAPQEA
jgi:hypothetical protein